MSSTAMCRSFHSPESIAWILHFSFAQLLNVTNVVLDWFKAMLCSQMRQRTKLAQLCDVTTRSVTQSYSESSRKSCSNNRVSRDARLNVICQLVSLSVRELDYIRKLSRVTSTVRARSFDLQGLLAVLTWRSLMPTTSSNTIHVAASEQGGVVKEP